MIEIKEGMKFTTLYHRNGDYLIIGSIKENEKKLLEIKGKQIVNINNSLGKDIISTDIDIVKELFKKGIWVEYEGD